MEPFYSSMEEPSAVDCPPTPEILPNASTPPARHEATYSSSSEEADESADGRRSPPPKCAICLGKCRQPSSTNSCSHKFCLQCLLAWSKVKPECPLCKQPFCEISYDKPSQIIQVPRPVDQYHLPQPSSNMYHFFVSERARFTYHTSLMVRPSQSDLLQQLFMHQSSDVQRFVREFGNQPIPSRQNVLEWRRFIYVQRLFARPLPDINGRFRAASSAYFLRNYMQMNRILPWVARELSVISPSLNNRPEQIVLSLMQEYDVDSSIFLQCLEPVVPMQYRAHFQHELVNFARSPYDMVGYDRCVQYDPPFRARPSPTRSPGFVISSSEPDDDDIVYLSPSPPSSAMNGAASRSNSSTSSSTSTSTSTNSNGNGNSNSNININITNTLSNSNSSSTSGRLTGRTEFRIEARSSGETVIMTGTLGDSGAAQDPSISQASTGTQTRVIELNDDTPSPAAVSASATQPGRIRPSTLQNGDNISLSSTDSDECQFVREQKPPHLRTPDHVVDLSASDSDVVFVDEGPVPAPQLPPAAGTATASQQSQLKNETTSGFECNQGASTSSGYCGGAGGMSGSNVAGATATPGQRPKYYAMPTLNRYTGGRGIKSIYEASDTDDSDGEMTVPAYIPPSSSSASSSHEEIVFRSVAAPGVRVNRTKANNPTDGAADKSNKSTRKGKQIGPAKAKRNRGVGIAGIIMAGRREAKRRKRRAQEAALQAAATAAATTMISKTSSSSTKSPTKSSKRKNSKTKSSGGPRNKRAKRAPKVEPGSHQASPLQDPSPFGGAHYFVETRPSSSPTIADEGAAGGARTPKLKSVIIKRCNYSKKPLPTVEPIPTSTPMVEQTNPPGVPAVESLLRLPANASHQPPVAEMPSTSGLGVADQPGEDSTAGGNREETAAAAGVMQFSLESESDTEGLSVDVFPPIVPNFSQYGNPNPTSQLVQEHREEESVQGQDLSSVQPAPTAQSTEDDQRMRQFSLDNSGGMLMEEESDSIASESLFAPSLNWSGEAGESHEPSSSLAIGDDHLSSAAVSPFSSVSLPPSTTASVSTSPTLSLAVPTPSSPTVELLEVVSGTADAESHLPSSVVDIGAIDGTMDEIMATVEVPAISTTTAVTEATSSEATLPGCVLEAIAGPAADNETVGAEVEL
uniref:RING-type E3 ubiquitin transferase n=1 Tax=Anopheles atroparvus TaxID=41427 RepID=A0A182JA33_ANOAO